MTPRPCVGKASHKKMKVMYPPQMGTHQEAGRWAGPARSPLQIGVTVLLRLARGPLRPLSSFHDPPVKPRASQAAAQTAA